MGGIALVHSKSIVEHQVRVLDQDNDNSDQQETEAGSWFKTTGTNETIMNNSDDEPHEQQHYQRRDDDTVKGQQQERGEDPMLVSMPGEFSHFKVYRRADISSFYQEPPGSRTERTPAFTGQAGKFVNMSPERLELHWYVRTGNDKQSFFLA